MGQLDSQSGVSLGPQFDEEAVSGSFTGGVGVPCGAIANSLNDIHFQVARVGLNYRIGSP
jgi:hypothetical protein